MSIEEKELQIVQATNDWAKSLRDFQSQINELDQQLETDLQANKKSLSAKHLALDQELVSKLQSGRRSAENDSSRLSSSKDERLRSLDNAISNNRSQIADNNHRLTQLKSDIDTYVGRVERTLRDNIDAERRRVAEQDAEVINKKVSNYTYYREHAADYTPQVVVDEDMIYTWDKPSENRLRIASNCMMVVWLLIAVTAILVNITSGVANPIGKVMFNPFIIILLAVVIIVWVAYMVQYKRGITNFKDNRQSVHDMYETKAGEWRQDIHKWFQEHPYYLPQGTSANSYIPMGASKFSYTAVPYRKVNVNEQLNKAVLSCRSSKPAEVGSDFTFELDPTFKSLFN